MEYDFPIGELDHALFDRGLRVGGDPKKVMNNKMRGQWKIERAAKLREGCLMKTMAKVGVQGGTYEKVMQGREGFKAQRHVTRLVMGSYKTVEWWFRAHPEVFGVLKGEEVIREEGLEGRKKFECAYMCPRCGGERETVSHMFGGCPGNRGVLDKFNSEIREYLKVQVPWVENMVGWAIGGVNMVRHEGGLWGIIRGELEGQVVTQEEEGGQRASFEKVRECPQWLINAGLVPIGLKQIFKMMLEFSEEGVRGEVCLRSKGAKMGIGKKRDCECKSCRVKNKTEKVYKWVVNKCLEMGLTIWDERCEDWGDYCELHEIKVPRARSRVGVEASRFGAADQSGGVDWDSEGSDSDESEGEAFFFLRFVFI